MPERIQRLCTKGWRKPDGAVNVTRPGPWGNQWKEGSTSWICLPGGKYDKTPHPPLTREQAIESFRNSMSWDPEWVAVIRRELGGKDLMCWCRIDQACHADVLLELANGTRP